MQSDQEMDYRFGWRWLLPFRNGDLVLLLGFDELEMSFWKRTLRGVGITQSTSEATVLLVNDLLPGSVNVDAAQSHGLCVVGSGKTVAAWSKWTTGRSIVDSCCYGLLPANKPRIVLPLGKNEWIARGLTLHRPGRWWARCAVFVLKSLAQCGLDRPLRTRMLFIARNDSYLMPHGACDDGFASNGNELLQGFALYLGTPDECRKTVIMPLDASPPTIVKHGESSKAKAAIRNEAEVLAAMSKTALASRIPLLYEVVENDGCVALHQEYRPRKNISGPELARQSLEFLADLSRQARTARLLDEVLIDVGSAVGCGVSEAGKIAYLKVRSRLESLARRNAKVWGHRSHGDYAPWNYAWTEKGFFVFDWEESKQWDVAFSDVFYRILGPAINVARAPSPALIESEAITTAISLSRKAELPFEDIRVYWGLWLLQRLGHKGEPLYELLLEKLALSWK